MTLSPWTRLWIVNGVVALFALWVAPAGAQTYSLIGHVDSGLDVVQHIVAGGGEDFRSDGPPFLSVSVLTVDVRRL